jgi:uncharacterized protein (DUF1778 family)
METGDMIVPTCPTPVVPPSDPLENECCVRLSDRDAEQVLKSIDPPPAPNEAALAAAKRFLQKQG